MAHIASDNSLVCQKPYIFWGLCNQYRSVAVVGIGDPGLGYNELEEIDERKQAIRVAAHVGFQALQTIGIKHIDFDGMGNAEAVAEGATLSSFVFEKYRKDKTQPTDLALFKGDTKNWTQGLIKGHCQNLVRVLTETPSNLKPPRKFAEKAQEELEKHGVTVDIRDKKWIESKKMGGLLSVSQGSDEPPVFIEMSYTGVSSKRPIVLVGKGVTFDTGGYSLKPSKDMHRLRADCGGASIVVATMKAVAQLQLPINVIGLAPMTENMINGKATRPGDVITMMNGKTVSVEDTDAEGRLILGDALTYSATFDPEFVLDLATLTGAIRTALGSACTGVFTNSASYWKILQRAGSYSGDRMWKMPLWKFYTKNVTDYDGYDVNNMGKGVGGGACKAAAFLREFIPEDIPWAHLDVATVTGIPGAFGDKIISHGMTGKPTRTLIKFLQMLSEKECIC